MIFIFKKRIGEKCLMFSIFNKDRQSDEKRIKAVYCDNDKLKKYILDAKPSNSGLYPHEIVMINRAKIGQLKTINTVFPSLFLYQYSVQYPALLLKSLIERGFIKESTPSELLENLNAADLRTLMKNKNLKSKGTSSKDNMRAVIRENYSLNEISELLEFNLYLPTVLGEQELEQNNYLIENEYGAWNLNCGYEKNKYILPTEIKIIDMPIQELSISQNGFICKIGEETIKGWVHHLVPDTKINILIDGKIIWRDLPADIIYFLKNTKMIIVATNKLNKTEKTIQCTGYHIVDKKILYTETIADDISSYFPLEKFKKFDELHSFEGVIVENKIKYYVSINNLLAKHIITELFTDTISMGKLSNYLEDDDSLNYIISADVNDTYARNIIMHMIANNLLQAPVIKGVTFHKILNHLRASRKNKTQIAFVEDYIVQEAYEQEVADEVKEKCNQDWTEFYKTITKTYPKRVFLYDMFKNYSSENVFKHDVNMNEIINNKAHWDNEFKLLIEKLMLDGKIAPRWINEFSLYSITIAYFPETVYQYRDSWLGRQSLDIYVPTLKIGLEYQGQQHYSAVDFFGGEEGYVNRQMLDDKKKQLCNEKGIKLIEWPFTKEVNTQNFIEIFKSLGISLPDLK